jgi:nicotinamidase-related amidase
MKQALLITDVQEDFLGNSDYLVPLCQKYLDEHADDYDLVILTHWKHQENKGVHTLLLSHPSARVAEKSTYSAITAEVRAWLEERGIQRVHLAGLDAEATVMATMYHLLDLGYEVQILERLLASYFTRGWEATTIMRHVLGNEHVLSTGGGRVWL